MLKIGWASRAARAEWEDLLREAKSLSTMPDSPLHGDAHWRAVASSGLDIADADAGVNRRLVVAFGLIHDFQRIDDGWDEEHGARAANAIGRLKSLPAMLSRTEISKLKTACEDHEKGFVSEDPAIGACWDADRVNLWRIGVKPDPAFFSVLRVGRGFEEVSHKARETFRNPPGWQEIFERLRAPRRTLGDAAYDVPGQPIL